MAVVVLLLTENTKNLNLNIERELKPEHRTNQLWILVS